MKVPKSTSGTQNWRTPPELFAWADRQFNFTLDAAAAADNALCKKFYTEFDNGLMQSWAGEVVWVNPPFKQIKIWLAKAVYEVECNKATVVMLLPAATETRWFRQYVTRGEIAFLTPRVKYVHPDGMTRNGPPIGSMLVAFVPGKLRFADDEITCAILDMREFNDPQNHNLDSCSGNSSAYWVGHMGLR